MTEPFFAPRFDVRVEGTFLGADIAAQVARLAVTTDLDMAGSFALVLRNPDNAVLDSALFDFGKSVEIHIGYGTELEPALLGEITSIEPSFPNDGPPAVYPATSPRFGAVCLCGRR
jgi:phage protein D